MSVLAILIASLLGSVHCAAMCGGFVSIASDGQKNPFRGLILYNSGRLITYLLLGLVAGWVGKSVDSIGLFAGFAHVAAILLGSVLIAHGLLRLLSGDKPTRLSKFFHEQLGRLYRVQAQRLPKDNPLLRAFGIGLLSTLLPCGWLYGFVAVAASTADPLRAIGVMGVFWLGTLPMMVAFGAFVRSLLLRWGAQVPAISSVLLILAGLFSIAAHLNFISLGHSHHHLQLPGTDGSDAAMVGNDYCGASPPPRSSPEVKR